MRQFRSGIIGSGGIANYHIAAMKAADKIIPYALCDVDAASLERMGERYGIPQTRRYTDYREMMADPGVDVVSICTPNITHYDIAMQAVKSRKPYALEKPVSMTVEQARTLMDETIKAGLVNTVCFSYRYLPAVRYAKKVIQSGALGKIYHVYGQYIEGKDDNERVPLLWRYQKELAGSGSLGDLGSHLIDMIRYLVGDFEDAAGCSGILVKQREKLDGSGLGEVTTEDYFHAMANLNGGVSATLAFTKFAWGRKNAHRLEIYGSKGGMIYTLEKGVDNLRLCLGDIMGLSGDWTQITLDRNVPNQMDCFYELLMNNKCDTPASIADGYMAQVIIDAMLASEEKKTWCSVSDYR